MKRLFSVLCERQRHRRLLGLGPAALTAPGPELWTEGHSRPGRRMFHFTPSLKCRKRPLRADPRARPRGAWASPDAPVTYRSRSRSCDAGPEPRGQHARDDHRAPEPDRRGRDAGPDPGPEGGPEPGPEAVPDPDTDDEHR